jgi:hypothetical protein
VKLDTDKQGTPIVTVCRSFGETLLERLDAITVHGADPILRNTPLRNLEDKQRTELITSINGGQHIELTVRAKTFRQRDGSPNRNHLRFKKERLPAIASSFKGQPMLLDHNKWSQRYRMGSIVESLGEEGGHGWFNFDQTLHVVKPEGVKSVLDGTIDRFSIGWLPIGTVVCTAHGEDVMKRGSCFRRGDCYPGRRVEVDGEAKIAEYEFQNAEGIEVSAVNVPAVVGTRVDDVKRALALELGIALEHDTERNEGMAFMKLAAILGLAALNDNDEDRAVAAVGKLQADLTSTSAQLAAYKERAEQAEATLATERKEREAETKSRLAADVDACIERAYNEGKLARTQGTGADGKATAIADVQEQSLRALGQTSGAKFLGDFLSSMPQKVPLGHRVADPAKLPAIAPTEFGGAGPSEPSKEDVDRISKHLGITPDQYLANWRTLNAGASASSTGRRTPHKEGQ